MMYIVGESENDTKVDDSEIGVRVGLQGDLSLNSLNMLIILVTWSQNRLSEFFCSFFFLLVLSWNITLYTFPKYRNSHYY